MDQETVPSQFAAQEVGLLTIVPELSKLPRGPGDQDI